MILRHHKKTGSYYTPTEIADFIVKRIFDERHYTLAKTLRILEPSVGDGVFIDAISRNVDLHEFKIHIDAVERDSSELFKASKIANPLRTKGLLTYSPHGMDYLIYSEQKNGFFDLVVGNPPYIKKNFLTKKQIQICESVHAGAGLSARGIKNIWTAFLVDAVQSLSADGVFAFVLPAELLQVGYTKEIRNFLRNSLKKIEIFAFNQPVFDGIEQDVVVIIGSKKAKIEGVSFFQANTLEDLKRPDLIDGNTNIDRQTLDKWTNYILSTVELDFLDGFRKKMKSVDYYADSQVGIVTGNNDFFIVDRKTAESEKILRSCHNVIQKSSMVEPCAVFSKADFSALERGGAKTRLFAVVDLPARSQKATVRGYIKKGEIAGVQKGYKSKKRNNWFSVPDVRVPDAVFPRRCNVYPRIMVNDARVRFTDSFYVVNAKENYSVSSISFCFLNTLSLIFCELEGRFYGGGVLELTPNEFKKIPIPYFEVTNRNLQKLDKMIRSKIDMTEILDFTDRILLKDTLSVSDEDVSKLKKIHKRLVARRIRNKD